MEQRVRDKLIFIAATKAECICSSQHAAIITHLKGKGRILATGWNKRKSHPLCVEHQPNPNRIYLHAEMDVIIKVMNRYGVEILKDCKLSVLRLTKGGRVSNSKPCQGCNSLINAVGVGEVEWTTD